jgi:hypothetical protein
MKETIEYTFPSGDKPPACAAKIIGLPIYTPEEIIRFTCNSSNKKGTLWLRTA